MPTISVIIPVYKVEEYLSLCVDSVLAQTYPDFEVILVDDGSPDNCGAICDEYAEKDPRVRVIHRENGGLSAARNSGTTVCTGEYVTFLDSDDMLHPQTLELLMAAIEKTGCNMSLAGFSWDEAEVFSQTWSAEDLQPESLDWKEASARMGEIQFITASAKLYPREIVQETLFPVGKKHEDEFTTYKYYFAAQSVAALSLPLYFYRPNPNGIMATRDLRSIRDDIDAHCEQMAFFEAQGLPELAQKAKGNMGWWTAEYAILCKAQKKKNDLPKKLRVSVPIALRRMKHNTSADRFLHYLQIAYPRLSKLYCKKH